MTLRLDERKSSDFSIYELKSSLLHSIGFCSKTAIMEKYQPTRMYKNPISKKGWEETLRVYAT